MNDSPEQRTQRRTRELADIEARLRQALELNESILNASTATVLVYREDGQCILANPAAVRMVGGSREQLLAQNFNAIASWTRTGLQDAAHRVLVTNTPETLERRFQTTFGLDIWAEIHLSTFDMNGSRHLLLMLQDISDKRRAEEELRLAASVFHASAEGVMITDAEGLIISVNPAFTDITGYSAAETLGRKPSMLKSDHQRPEFYGDMWNTLLAEGRWQGELWNRRKGGQAYLEWLTINRIDDSLGKPIRYVAVFHDITEMRRKDEHIHHLALHDALTGLPNRELLMERLNQALVRSLRERQRLSVAFIDLDRFKGINDALGHDIGDNLLQQVGDRIRRCLRTTDTVARVGGDEFLVLMENLTSARDCATKAQQLLDEIARPIALPGYKVEIGASMGMAFYPEDSDQPLELMKRADMAMYAAKEAGGHTYRFFRQEMLERTTRRLTLEMDLRRAIANNELELHYQPKIDLIGGGITGVEALLRWRHPRQGMQAPAEFIPLAEENALICDIGAWVIDEACRQSAQWRSRGVDLRIAVNVSTRQLESGNLLQQLCALAHRHGISAACLELEITESTLMEDPERVAGLLQQFREAGMRIAVDDFGTGYSSLAYLRRLPIDILKIDRSFVLDALADEEDAQIIKTILALGQSLKLAVVAEGVENESQASLLQSLGCDQAQGYLYARPMPANDLESWLHDHRATRAACNHAEE